MYFVKHLSLLLLASIMLGGAPMPSYADGEKAAKPSKGKKKKKKAKKTKKEKKDKAAKSAARKTSSWALSDVQIADVRSPFDGLFNQAIERVNKGTYGPDDFRVNGKPLFAYAAARGQLNAMKMLKEAGADPSFFSSCADAIAGGSVPCIKYMQELGIPLCIPGDSGIMKRSLMQATLSGNLECVSYVYEQMLPFACPDRSNLIDPKLRYAALESGKKEMVEFWQNKGVGPQKHDVLFAALGGNMEILNSMQDKMKNLDYSRKSTHWDAGGNAYVMMSARSGNPEMLKFFIEKGASTRYGDKEEPGPEMYFSGEPKSPIIQAALSGSMECVKLLEGKVDAPRDVREYSLLEAAVSSGNLELVKYLAPKEQSSDRISRALCLAAHLGLADIVKYLVEDRSADVNTDSWVATVNRSMLNWYYTLGVVKSSSTPLVSAAGSGDLALVRYLIEKGADVNKIVKGNNRFWDSSPLEESAKGQPHILKHLLEICTFASDEEKNHLLMKAAYGGSLACLKLAYDTRVDVNAEIREGESKWSAFDSACGSEMPGRKACVEFLLAKGAKAQPENVVSAVFRGNYDCLPLIYAQGVRSPQVGSDQPILQRAARAGRLDAIKLMVENGLDLQSGKKSHDGPALRSVVLGACAYMVPGHLDCVRYLTSKGARLDPEELNSLVEDAPEPLRKVLQETHK